MKIMVTGGMGYIGVHTSVELLNAGHEVIVLDNLCNSNVSILERVRFITKKDLVFIEGDIRDRAILCSIFKNYHIDAVIHFAGLKAVGESVSKPLEYYDNNVAGSLVLLEAMDEAGVKSIVFSSSATVYGDPHAVPITEDFPLHAVNPYGCSKLMVEGMLRDLSYSDPVWRIAVLRYFNPIGAHDSGLIGEEPNGTPNNLLPYIAQVASGQRKILSIYGNDYATLDGTGVRDYIHVVDLALGHLRTLEKLMDNNGVVTYNLGTGRGTTVLEVVRAFEKACGRDIPYQIVARRPGDISQCYADPAKAERELGWKAVRDVDKMCVDAWAYQTSTGRLIRG